MIVIKSKTELTCEEIAKCNKLIEDNFGNSRFETYEKVIYYIIEDEIVGFVGISDNYLNQLCTDINYRKRGIASEIIESAKGILGGTIYLFINKNNKDNKDVDILLKFYVKLNFNIEYENEVEYKMICLY
jgi:ribosomal protein S18 acetylase RimI-like enzyme